MSTGQCHVNDS